MREVHVILQAYQAFHEETRSRWHLGKANANLGARVLPPVTCSLTGTCPEDGKAAIAGGQPIQDVRRSPDERREAGLLQTAFPSVVSADSASTWVVTGGPSSWRALTRCSLFGSGESWGDGPASLLVEGQHDTAAPSSCGAADRQQKDAPQSASQ